MEYVQRVIPLVNDDMKEKYINVWSMFLGDEEIMSYLLQTKDRNFNHFNKYHVHGILGVMKSNGFFKKISQRQDYSDDDRERKHRNQV